MTGYGKAEYIFAEHKTTVEIRTLNSKQLDLSLKSASAYHDKELEIRGMLREQLERGKVDVLIAVHPLETTESEQFTPINWQAMNYYVEDYKRHAAELGFSVENVPAEVLSGFPDRACPDHDVIGFLICPDAEDHVSGFIPCSVL